MIMYGDFLQGLGLAWERGHVAAVSGKISLNSAFGTFCTNAHVT
jgi:hypothetical protein